MGNTKHLVGVTRPTFTIDDQTRKNLDELSKSLGKSRSEIVRIAVAKMKEGE